MTRDVPTVKVGQPLEMATRLMQEKQASEVAVIDEDDRLVGYVSRENLAEFMMIENAEPRARCGRAVRALGRAGRRPDQARRLSFPAGRPCADPSR